LGNIGLSGSFIIGGIVLMTLIVIFLRFNDTTQEMVLNEIAQSSLSDLSNVIDYDFNKIGYRVSSATKITSIDTNAITFLADLNNDGTVDSVSYYTGDFNNALNLVRRTTATSVQEWRIRIDRFYVEGYDSLNNLTYNTSNIRSLQVEIISNADEFTTDTPSTLGAFWERRYFPKNL